MTDTLRGKSRKQSPNGGTSADLISSPPGATQHTLAIVIQQTLSKFLRACW